MKKRELKQKTADVKNEVREALQTMYGAMNSGQQKQIVKDENVKALFIRHGVAHGE